MPYRKRILLADSDQDTREIYATALRYSGFDVIEACNGAEALERAGECAPDLIVSALALPAVDGCEVLRRVKHSPGTRPIPFLVVTTDFRVESRWRAEQDGCDGYFEKPFLPHQLLEAIHGLMERAGR